MTEENTELLVDLGCFSAGWVSEPALLMWGGRCFSSLTANTGAARSSGLVISSRCLCQGSRAVPEWRVACGQGDRGLHHCVSGFTFFVDMTVVASFTFRVDDNRFQKSYLLNFWGEGSWIVFKKSKSILWFGHLLKAAILPAEITNDFHYYIISKLLI